MFRGCRRTAGSRILKAPRGHAGRCTPTHVTHKYSNSNRVGFRLLPLSFDVRFFSCSLFLSSSHRPPPCSPPLLSQLFVIRSQKAIQATSTIEVFCLFFLTQRRGRNEFFIFCQRHALQEPTVFAQNHGALDFYPLVSQSARRREIALSSRRKRGPNLQTLKAQRETFPRDLFAQS